MIGRALRWTWNGWNRFWFEPAAALDLGLARIFFCAGVLAAYGMVDFAEWGTVARQFWMPLPLFERLGLEPLAPETLGLVALAWRSALVLTAIGLWTRVSATVAAVTGIYLLGLPHNFGHTFHFDALLALALIVLALSRCGDACSIDALLQRARPAPDHAEYRWPIRMIWCLMALVFGAAGLAKLRYGGLGWITSSNMQVILERAAYHTSDADPITGLGLWIAAHPLLSHAIAAGSVAAELFFPLALFSRRLRPILVTAAIGLLVGIRITMGPTFGGFLVANVFWVPWTRVVAWARARASAKSRVTVIYDGACGLCAGSMSLVGRLDLLDRVRFADAARAWAVIHRRYPVLDHDACLADMHVVLPSGRIRRGFDAWREIAKRLPVAWSVVPLLYLPGVPWVGRWIYRVVANRRSRDVCAAGGVAEPRAPDYIND